MENLRGEVEIKQPMNNELSSLFKNFQVVSNEEYERFEAEEEKRKLENNLIQQQTRFEASGVGEKYFKYSLSDYIAETEEQKKCLSKVKEAIEKIKRKEPVTMW